MKYQKMNLEQAKALVAGYQNNPIEPKHFKDANAFADAVLKRNELLDEADKIIAESEPLRRTGANDLTTQTEN